MDARVLVLDLDGTVCLGDGPVLAYADGVAAVAPGASDLRGRIHGFLTDPRAEPALADAQDGYQAVAILAAAAGISGGALGRAYLRSRELLAADPSSTHAPEGLADLLTELRAAYAVTVVLVTNAPATGLDRLLAHLGVADLIDQVRPDAGKPVGLPAELLSLLGAHGLQDHPDRLLSVGDIWRNDLGPALECGCATAYVDPFDRAQGPAHARGRSLTDLYPDVRAWAADPARFVAEHPLGAAAVTEPQTSWTN